MKTAVRIIALCLPVLLLQPAPCSALDLLGPLTGLFKKAEAPAARTW